MLGLRRENKKKKKDPAQPLTAPRMNPELPLKVITLLALFSSASRSFLTPD